MSISELSRAWPVTNDLNEHARFYQAGVDHLRANSVPGEDLRNEIGLALLDMGSKHSAVLTLGMAGVAKTHEQAVIFGEDRVVTVESTATEATLWGDKNPVDNSDWIEGKVERVLSPSDPIGPAIALSELPNLGDTGPFHRLFDGESFTSGQRIVSSGDLTVSAAGNWPDSQSVRVKELDPAMLDRFAIYKIAGDVSDETASEIYGRDLGQLAGNGVRHLGILPTAAARNSLRNAVQGAMPLGENFSDYIGQMIEDISSLQIDGSPVFNDITKGSFRISQGWQQAARSLRMAYGDFYPSRIGADEAAMVASLVLPTVVKFTHTGKSVLANSLGMVSRVDRMTEEIALRRILATSAYVARQTLEVFEVKTDDERRNKFRDNFSYANPGSKKDAIDAFVEDVVVGNARTNTTGRSQGSSNNGKKSRFPFRNR